MSKVMNFARSVFSGLFVAIALVCSFLLLLPIEESHAAGPQESFVIDDVEIITGTLGTTWVWPVEIEAEGSFIVSVNNLSCQGLAETYEGNFRVEVEGPITFDFTNYVKSGFLTGREDPNSGITIIQNGIVVFNKRISAPICDIPKPLIDVLSSEPYTRGNMLLVNIGMPDNADVLEISTDFAFLPDTDRLPKGCSFVKDYRNIRCEESGGHFHLDLIESFNPGQKTFLIRARAQFLNYDVTYGNGHPQSINEVYLPLNSKYVPSCAISSQKIDVATYRYNFSWKDNTGDYVTLHAGSSYANPTHANFEGLNGSSSFTTTYPFSSSAVFTATLFVPGAPGVRCEEVIVLQSEIPEASCSIKVREVEGKHFAYREIKVFWFNSYWWHPHLNFGDGDVIMLGPDNNGIQVNGESNWISHPYSWDYETGFAEYTAEIVVPVGQDSIRCTEYIEILDPELAPSVPTPDPEGLILVTYLPDIER